MNCTGFFFYGIPYFIQEPIYKCTYTTDDHPADICNEDGIYDDSEYIASWSIVESDEKSLNNWTLKLDLTNESSTTRALIGSAFFIGWAITLLWLPRFGDIFGRKKMYVIGMIIDTVIFVVIFFTKNVYVMIVSQLIFGANTSIRVNIGYPYLMEMCPKSG